MRKLFLQKMFAQAMRKATHLTGKGNLIDATRLIQRALAGAGTAASTAPSAPRAVPPQPAPPDDIWSANPTGDVTDVEAKPARPAANDRTASPANAPSQTVPNAAKQEEIFQQPSPPAGPFVWTPAARPHRPGAFYGKYHPVQGRAVPLPAVCSRIPATVRYGKRFRPAKAAATGGSSAWLQAKRA